MLVDIDIKSAAGGHIAIMPKGLSKTIPGGSPGIPACSEYGEPCSIDFSSCTSTKQKIVVFFELGNGQ